MDDRPSIKELENKIAIVNWHSLGIQLELNPRKLNEIEQETRTITNARRRMFQLWLDTSPSPTRREMIKELESCAVGESALAMDYKKYVETLGGTSVETRCEYDEGVNYDSADVSSELMPKIQIPQRTMTTDVSCYNSAFWMIASLGVLLLGVIPVLYKLQEIKHLLHVHVVMQPVTTKTDLKEVLYDSGSYLKVNTFGEDYAVHLKYLTPDYGRVILDLYNSDTQVVIQHSNIRYSGCGLYRESNVIVLNTQLDGEWGKVERPRGFPFFPGQITSFMVTAAKDAFVIVSESGGTTFKYYYRYRSKAKPENIDRIDTYILEYRDCLPALKGKVLQFDLGKQIKDFRPGAIITVIGTAPSNVGKTLGLSITKGPTEMKEYPSAKILSIEFESGKDFSAGAQFTITFTADQYSIQVSVNDMPCPLHETKYDVSSDPFVVCVWVTGVYELHSINSDVKSS